MNSIDFICDDHGQFMFWRSMHVYLPHMNLYETRQGDLMREHILACKERRLPKEERTTMLRAHAIVYAHKDIKIPSDFNWPLWTADRPHLGEEIPQFEPICNVFSGGKNYSQVCEMIMTRKKAVLNKLAI